MRTKAGHFVIEFLFVIGSVMLLKNWIFPLLISFWFPALLAAELFLEWTMIIVGAMMIFIYLGLGSSSKQAYRLSLIQAVGIFFGLHFLFFIPTFSLVDQFYMYWEHLIKDFFSLFFPRQTFYTWQLVTVYFILYLVGRTIRVKDEKTELKSGCQGMPTRLKMRNR
ncbi:hypothetical protein [Thermoactinomyces mirandus]|uniref:Uncharacterized protein n=1 Tax=Thermoactinomyces mirandus TaxID=2756294 RepID=A0A7W1XSX7_9BACL|nr:hypothetical protein [Thermoactinomyces mirandus]MBA4602561.1 hypothetical protein [Thermoactinomyces mirandus]